MAWQDEEAESVEECWQREHAEYPGMAKSTFVGNKLFSMDFKPDVLGAWILDQDDLEQQVWQGGVDCHLSMIEIPQPDGTSHWRTDPTGRRVLVRVRLEAIRSGKDTIDDGSRFDSWSCSDD